MKFTGFFHVSFSGCVSCWQTALVCAWVQSVIKQRPIKNIRKAEFKLYGKLRLLALLLGIFAESMGAEQSQLQEQSISEFRQDYISFFVNGKEYNVQTNGDPEIGPKYLLVDYLRDKLGLTGTKYMCREGGCGSCIVMLKSTHPASGREVVGAANSCLLPLFACDSLDITTIEGLGNSKKGYSMIQDRLVKFGGTQCGFCSPSMVMNMMALVQNKPRFTGGDIEYSMDVSICRCTGYRPIVDAFKSLSANASEEVSRICQDIEDCYKCPLQGVEDVVEDSKMEIVQPQRNLLLHSNTGQKWIKVTGLPTLFEIIQKFTYSQTRYRLVAGNTGIGFYSNDGPYEGFVEIDDVPDLHVVSFDQSGMVLGGGTTLTAAIDQFQTAMGMDGFVYASEFYKLFRRIATLSIRNQATLAGNLILKHDHRDFNSDVFLLFESVGATIKIASSPTTHRDYTLLQFLDLDMNGKVILSIHLPIIRGNFSYRTFKVGKRYQNALGYVTAAFLFSVDTKNNFAVVSRPSICYGGINPEFVHANASEDYLHGKPLTVATLQAVLLILGDEVAPNFVPEAGTQEYRLRLAQSYLYKFLLNIRGDAISPRLKSGAADVERGLNTGTQTFDTDKSKWPLYQPLPKLESLPQTSGEAKYINDIRAELNELFGAFVLTTVANADIKSIDASEALMSPNVVAFITAKDIPGINNYTVFLSQPEEIFVSKRVRYAGQPVGLLVAKDKYTAFEARSKVKVFYENIQKPILDIKDAIKYQEERKVHFKDEEVNLAFPCKGINAQTAKDIMKHRKQNSASKTEFSEKVIDDIYKLKGEFRTHAQYHFHLETQICICVPTENNSMKVYSSTQHMDSTQAAIAACLNVPNNSINIRVRQLGGGFEAKISRQNHVATACAVAAYITHQPVRVALDLETNMHMIGKRLPYLVKYEVDVDETGKIRKLDSTIYCDTGYIATEPTSLYAMICFQSCYKANSWDVKPAVALTSTCSNTYCRSSGSSQGMAAIEHIMEHIAYTVKKDPLEVRMVNFIQKGDPYIGVPGAKLPLDNLLPKMINELVESSDYVVRKKYVEVFNQSNRWKKRGLSMLPQRFPNYYPDLKFPTLISVYHVDGSVNVSHGGIEMGQGINTKVAQVVAHTLQIPISKVRVQPSNNLVSSNAGISGASITSELICNSAQLACQQLLAKLVPLRSGLANPTWEQLISAANTKGILLTSQYQDMQGDLVSYDVWGLTVIEVEMDVLTGDYKIIRADLVEDAGYSISPLIDIGQIEGGFVMGLGWWLTEELVYDTTTGALITDNTKTYKPMLPADIPEDIRVTLLRNAPNPFGVLSSKAVGEPPFNMSVAVIFALRNAIDSARRDAGNHSWYDMDGPVTREVIRRLALSAPEQFTF